MSIEFSDLTATVANIVAKGCEMERNSERFGMKLKPTEKRALEKLAERERISEADVLRRLLWSAAEQLDKEQNDRALGEGRR